MPWKEVSMSDELRELGRLAMPEGTTRGGPCRPGRGNRAASTGSTKKGGPMSGQSRTRAARVAEI